MISSTHTWATPTSYESFQKIDYSVRNALGTDEDRATDCNVVVVVSAAAAGVERRVVGAGVADGGGGVGAAPECACSQTLVTASGKDVCGKLIGARGLRGAGD